MPVLGTRKPIVLRQESDDEDVALRQGLTGHVCMSGFRARQALEP